MLFLGLSLQFYQNCDYTGFHFDLAENHNVQILLPMPFVFHIYLIVALKAIQFRTEQDLHTSVSGVLKEPPHEGTVCFIPPTLSPFYFYCQVLPHIIALISDLTQMYLMTDQ